MLSKPNKKLSLLYRLQKKFFTFLGDIKVFGWKHPLWFEINAHGYKLKGEHYRKLQKLLQPGDILVRRFEGYLSSYMLPGWWNHAGIYIGGKKEEVIHAISEGVQQEDVLNFMRTDHMIVLRVRESTKETQSKCIKRAKEIVGKPYDFAFDFTNASRFSCTELAIYCHQLEIAPKRRWNSFFKKVIVADDFISCPTLKVVWDSTNLV